LKSKTAWFDNNHEGKALRRIFNKLMKRFEKEFDNEDTEIGILGKIAYTLSIIAKTKAELAKPENEYIARLSVVESRLGIGVKRISGVLESKG